MKELLHSSHVKQEKKQREGDYNPSRFGMNFSWPRRLPHDPVAYTLLVDPHVRTIPDLSLAPRGAQRLRVGVGMRWCTELTWAGGRLVAGRPSFPSKYHNALFFILLVFSPT